ncbi:MAG TPA: dienelactone hydrolase family protein [Planctomycetota bacterium]|nr:dienelactone hydrolase family protein [Planctomycetota bacterium]
MSPFPLLLALLQGATQPAIATESRSLKVGDQQAQAFFARPANGTHPGLVVVHEWWGMNDQIEGVAQALAREGYAAIVPDLYGGKVATGPDLAHEMMRGLEDGKVVRILRVAVASLRSDPAVGKEKIGIIGFCMGGKYALLTALEEEALSASVVCYGSVITEPEKLKGLRCPVLGIFGEKDEGIPPSQAKAFEEAAGKAGKEVKCTVYSGVGHAFLNEERAGHKPEVAGKAWKEIHAFLAKHLRNP